jgi:hypothetical protein
MNRISPLQQPVLRFSGRDGRTNPRLMKFQPTEDKPEEAILVTLKFDRGKVKLNTEKVDVVSVTGHQGQGNHGHPIPSAHLKDYPMKLDEVDRVTYFRRAGGGPQTYCFGDYEVDNSWMPEDEDGSRPNLRFCLNQEITDQHEPYGRALETAPSVTRDRPSRAPTLPNFARFLIKMDPASLRQEIEPLMSDLVRRVKDAQDTGETGGFGKLQQSLTTQALLMQELFHKLESLQ